MYKITAEIKKGTLTFIVNLPLRGCENRDDIVKLVNEKIKVKDLWGLGDFLIRKYAQQYDLYYEAKEVGTLGFLIENTIWKHSKCVHVAPDDGLYVLHGINFRKRIPLKEIVGAHNSLYV